MHEQRRVVQWATGNIGGRAAAGSDPAPRPRPRGRARLRPGEGRCRRGHALRRSHRPASSRRRIRPRSTRWLPIVCCTCRARSTSRDVITTARSAGRTSSRRAASSSTAVLGSDDDTRCASLDACARGGSSVYSTGSSPGFITDALPFALLSIQRRVESIEIDEFANLSRRDSPHLLFEQMGFGQAALVVQPAASRSTSSASSGPRSACSPRPPGRPVDTWNCVGEVAAARHATTILAGELSKPGRSPRSAPPSSGRATATTSCGSAPTGTAPTTSSPRGNSARRAGACACEARRRFDVDLTFPDPARRPRVVHARLHREPPGERDPVRLRRAPGHPRDGGPPADPARRPERHRLGMRRVRVERRRSQYHARAGNRSGIERSCSETRTIMLPRARARRT